jgi:Tetratricopeptide repeat
LQTQHSIVHRKRIGELLIEADLLRRQELPVALKEAERRSLKLGEVLVMLRYLGAADLENVLLAQTLLHEGTVPEALAISALKQASRQNVNFDEALRQVRQDADDKRAQSEMETAILVARAEDIERSRGPFDRDLGATFIDLAERQKELGKLPESAEALQRALKIFERAYGTKHLKVANCQAKLGELLLEQESYKEAESAFGRVLDILLGAWGEEHVQVANCHRSLARALEAQYKLREAEQYYIASLRVTERVCGEDSAEATDLLRHLAAFWRKQGRKPAHRRLGDLLLESALIKDGELNQALQYCRDNACPLGQALVRLNHLSQENLRPALQAQILISDGVLPAELATRALRAEHHGKDFSDALKELGWEPDTFTTAELNVLIEAAEELISAEAALGPEHAGVAVLSMKLADIYTAQGRYRESEPLYKRALLILQKSFGPKDAEAATALAKLAHLHLTENRAAQAEPLLVSALAIRQATYGDKHLDVAECLDLLAVAHERQSNHKEAEHLYRQAIKIRSELIGPKAESTQETEERLAGSLFHQNRLDESEQLYKKLAQTRSHEHGALHISLSMPLQRLGEIHMARKENEMAEQQFDLALQIHEKNDKSSLAAAELMEKVSQLLASTGRKEESRKMMERSQIAKRLRS